MLSSKRAMCTIYFHNTHHHVRHKMKVAIQRLYTAAVGPSPWLLRQRCQQQKCLSESATSVRRNSSLAHPCTWIVGRYHQQWMVQQQAESYYPNPLLHPLQQQYRSASKKKRRVKQMKLEREEAARKLVDVPTVMDDYVYITTVRQANEWATNTMVNILHKYISAQRTIFVGMHVVWGTTPSPMDDMASSDRHIKSPRQRMAILQLSLPYTPVAVFHFNAMRMNPNSSDNDDNSSDDDDNDMSDKEEQMMNNNEEEFNFPIQVKRLLELSNVVICAIRVHELLNELYEYEQIDCLTRVDVVDMANKALSYNDSLSMFDSESTSSTLRQFSEPSLPTPEILDHLCYYFLTVTDREEEMSFQRPVNEHGPNHIPGPPQEAMSDMLVRYYAAHVYHIRLLVSTMMDMIEDGEDQFVHEENDTLVQALDPNNMFNPYIEHIIQPIGVNRKVAILMTDDEYESFMVDDDGNDKSKRAKGRLHPTESKMKKTYSRQILALGATEFVSEPYGILRRLYNTSYLVGRDIYEDEVIVKLHTIKHPQFPILPLGCGNERYWKCPFQRYHEHENSATCFEWPDEPTLGWVFEHALRPHIVVDRSRLVLFNQKELIVPTDKPWLRQKKKVDFPDDLSGYL